MNATEVKGSQGAGLVGGSDSTNQAVDDAQDAARAAAEAARKAAEAAAAAAAERNAEKARELEAKARALADVAAKAAQKASNAAAKLAGALEKLENRGRSDLKLAAAVEKATIAAKAARTSASAALNSAAAATRSRAQKPVDRYESMKDTKLEYGPKGPPSSPPKGAVYGPPAPQAKPAATPTGGVFGQPTLQTKPTATPTGGVSGQPPSQTKPWHPPMAPPTQTPAWNRDSFGSPTLKDPFARPVSKPLTPEQRLELARERKLEQLERGGPMVPSNPVPQGFSMYELGRAGSMETKTGAVLEGELYTSPELGAGSAKLTAGLEGTAEYSRSLKASPPRLQPGAGMTVTFEVKQELKGELSPGINVERGLISGRAATKHGLSQETTYELTVPADKAELYQRNPMLAPDPFNPRTLPQGATLVVKMEDVRSTAVELEAGHVVGALPPSGKQQPGADGVVPANKVSVGGRVETGGATISGRSVAVERLEGNTVRLIAGPTEGLKGSFALGGFVADEDGTFEGSVKAEVERSFSSQNLRTLDIDLSKPGADVVYEHFLRTGQLPAGGGSAAVGGADVYQSSFKAGGKLEAAGRYDKQTAAVSVNTEYGIDQKQTFNQDGSISSEFTVNHGDRTLQVTESYKADGTVDPEGTGTHYVLQGAPPEVAEGLQRSFKPALVGPPAPITAPQNVDISLTPDEAKTLSALAKDYVGSWETRNNQTFNSASEPLIWALANAHSPEEASTALMDAGARNEDYYGLIKLAEFRGKPLPGTVRMVTAK